MGADTDPAWITVREAAALEGVAREVIYRRCNPTYPATIVYKETPKGRRIDLRSLSPKAHNAWLVEQMRLAGERRYSGTLPKTEYDPPVPAPLCIPLSQRPIVMKRFRLLRKAEENHRRLGFGGAPTI